MNTALSTTTSIMLYVSLKKRIFRYHSIISDIYIYHIWYIYIYLYNIYKYDMFIYIYTCTYLLKTLYVVHFSQFLHVSTPHPQPSCTCGAWFRCAQVLHTLELESYLEVCHPGFHIIGKMLGAPWDDIYLGSSPGPLTVEYCGKTRSARWICAPARKEGLPVYQPNHDAEYCIHTDAMNGHVLDHPGKGSHSKHLATIWWHDAKWEITESSILKISKDGLIFQLGPNSHRMACCVLVPFLRNDNASDAA